MQRNQRGFGARTATVVRRVAIPVAVASVFLPDVALAYVGPGAGLAFLGSLLAVVFAVLIALVAFIVFPIRLLIRAIKARRATAMSEAPAASGSALAPPVDEQ